MMKKTIMTLCAALAASMLMTACSGGGETGEAPSASHARVV